jgi:hypothetical protein
MTYRPARDLSDDALYEQVSKEMGWSDPSGHAYRARNEPNGGFANEEDRKFYLELFPDEAEALGEEPRTAMAAPEPEVSPMEYLRRYDKLMADIARRNPQLKRAELSGVVSIETDEQGGPT